MLEFYNKEDFYKWLPYNKDSILKYFNLSEDEFYNKYLENKVAQLDALDIKELVEVVAELSFLEGVNSFNYAV